MLKKILCISLAAAAFVACGSSSAPQAGVVEIAKFRKKANIGEAEFQESIRLLDSFVEKQPGFISREVGPDGKGGWVDVVKWRDLQSANAAMKASEQSEICAKAFALLDPKYLEMNHITVAHRFEKKL